MTPQLNIELSQNKEWYEFYKRGFDILFSIVILFTSLPLCLLIAIIIRLSSPGPILFSQLRIGQNRRRANLLTGKFPERRKGIDLKGKPIIIHKFRTMHRSADPYSAKVKTSEDDRLTLVGKFLRIACLDELPQFFNVLKGDLSIVGPRPEMPFIVEEYGDMEAQRLLIKPGITGLWQIYGTREKHIHENIHFDFEYIQSRSLLLDCFIIIKTFFYIFRTQNQ